MNKTVKILIICFAVAIIFVIAGAFFVIDRLSITKTRMSNKDNTFSYYLVEKRGLYGAESIKGEKLVPVKYDTVFLRESDWDIFVGRSGIYEYAYSLIGDNLANGYSYIRPDEELDMNYLQVRIEGPGETKFGIIDANGRVLLPCKYTDYSFEGVYCWGGESYDAPKDIYYNGNKIANTSDEYNCLETENIGDKHYLLAYSSTKDRMKLFRNGRSQFSKSLSHLAVHSSPDLETFDDDIVIKVNSWRNNNRDYYYWNSSGGDCIEAAAFEAIEEVN